MTFFTPETGWLAFREQVRRTPADLERLSIATAEARAGGRISVVDKTRLPPSGDPHDYMSQAPYWWPDPAKADGLPYVQRDGEVNPEFYGTDRDRLETFRERVGCLILHAHVTGDDSSARAAGRFLRGWFLDADTRMNPHLRFAQGIPGRCDGRGIGIIDTTFFCFLIDEIGRLGFNAEWTPADLAGVKGWFSAYLDWLLESKAGGDEAKEHNNHGTWYDAQVVTFALFCGREDVARRVLLTTARERLAVQIAVDGSQPHELKRTLSLSYCTFNLIGFAVLAQAGRALGIEPGAGFKNAVVWMLPYFRGEKAWGWKQIKPFQRATAVYLLARAGEATDDETLAAEARSLAAHAWEPVSFWGASVRGRKD